MVIQLSSTTNKDLYDSDYHLWILATVDSLKNQNIDTIDWQHLIDEVEDLSRRQKRRLKSLLRTLWEHLLKLTYWQSEIEKNPAHWKAEIRNFRKQIKDELEDSPSLKLYLEEIFLPCYQDAREIFSDRIQISSTDLPEEPTADLECILDPSWLPNGDKIIDER